VTDESEEAQPLDDIDALLHGLTRLAISAPPVLTDACGYTGEERYVAFFSENEGGRDNLHFDDGLSSARCDFMAWLVWRDHLCVFPHLISFEFAAPELSGRPARHWLLVDRQTQTLYVADRAAAARFLRDQVKDKLLCRVLVVEDVNGEMVTAEPGDAEAMKRLSLALDRRLRSSLEPPSEAEWRRHVGRIQARMDAEARLCDVVRAWLDAQITEQSVACYEAAMRAEYGRILAGLITPSSDGGEGG